MRGSEHDVLDRFDVAVRLLNPDIVVRVTGDVPLIEANFLDMVVETLVRTGADIALVPPNVFLYS